MNITQCTPAGKPPGWYDAAGTRYYHEAEIDRLHAELERLRGEREEDYVRGYVDGALAEAGWSVYDAGGAEKRDWLRAKARHRLAEEKHE